MVFNWGFGYIEANSAGDLAETVVTSSVHDKSETFRTYFSSDLGSLNDTLMTEDYVASLDILDKIRDRIQFQQYRIMRSFFPNVMANDGWRIKKQESVIESDLADTDYGVIFTQSYVNDQGHTIEINVVNAEELIRDYNDLFNNPNLVKGMGNTQLINQKGYKTIETIFEEANHYEQNIVLSNTVIMTLIAIGIDGVGSLNRFVEFVDIQALDSYLK